MEHRCNTISTCSLLTQCFPNEECSSQVLSAWRVSERSFEPDHRRRFDVVRIPPVRWEVELRRETHGILPITWDFPCGGPTSKTFLAAV